jgi:peptidoglycan/LPS O-acetylase OafA/YrhL
MVVAKEKERFHFLDGLRGIAAFLIVLHHALTPNIAPLLNKYINPIAGEFYRQFMQSGVELFFVLSGVVLLRPYLGGQRKLNVGDYFFRRFKRIYPTYFFALLFGALVIWICNTFPTWYNAKSIDIVFSWKETFREAFIFSFNESYYNKAWWSLQIEILFYLVVPLIIFLFPKQTTITDKKVVLAIIATFCLLFLSQHLLSNYLPSLYYYGFQTYKFGKFIEYPVCFLMGILLASRGFSLKQGYSLLFSGMFFVVLGIVLARYSGVYVSVYHSGYGLFYAGVITIAFKVNSFKTALSKPIMIWIGERSYSLFLVHFSVFYLTNSMLSHFLYDRGVVYGILSRGLGIPLSIFFAMLLFHFVERKQARGLMTADIFWPWQLKKLDVG